MNELPLPSRTDCSRSNSKSSHNRGTTALRTGVAHKQYTAAIYTRFGLWWGWANAPGRASVATEPLFCTCCVVGTSASYLLLASWQEGQFSRLLFDTCCHTGRPCMCLFLLSCRNGILLKVCFSPVFGLIFLFFGS